jgi:hypothetical protein
MGPRRVCPWAVGHQTLSGPRIYFVRRCVCEKSGRMQMAFRLYSSGSAVQVAFADTTSPVAATTTVTV